MLRVSLDFPLQCILTASAVSPIKLRADTTCFIHWPLAFCCLFVDLLLDEVRHYWALWGSRRNTHTSTISWRVSLLQLFQRGGAIDSSPFV